MSQHPSVAAETQKLSLGPPVVLLEIDTTPIGGTEILYISPQSFAVAPANYQAIVWRGQEYQPWPIEFEGFERQGDGPQPSPKVRVANINGLITELVQTYADMVGTQIIRHRTFKQFLDGESEADPDVELTPDLWLIDRKSAESPLIVEFELATPLDNEGQQLPGRQITSDYCPAIYRRATADGSAFTYDGTSMACPYAGAAMFDLEGNPVADRRLDQPSKRLTTCCRVRFGSAALPFMGFPGAGSVRL